MEKYLGKKLNAIWDSSQELIAEVKARFDKQSDDLAQLKDVSTAGHKAIVDALAYPKEGRKVVGNVSVDNLGSELKAYFDQTTLKTDVEFPELQKIAGEIGISNIDELVQALLQVIPEQKTPQVTVNTPELQEIFGKVMIKAADNIPIPVMLMTGDGSYIDLVELLGNAIGTAVSPSVGLPDSMVIKNPDGTQTLRTSASFGGTLTSTSAPTYKNDPTDANEAPKFGKVNPTTHKQQVEADVSGTVTIANPTANPETGLAKDATLASTNSKLDTLHIDLTTATIKVADDFNGGGYHADDQTGANGVLNFALGHAVNLYIVTSIGGTARARITGTPTATKGFVCIDGAPTYIPIPGDGTISVYAPTGAVVSVSGISR